VTFTDNFEEIFPSRMVFITKLGPQVSLSPVPFFGVNIVLHFRPPTIMLIDLLACWKGPLGLPISGAGGGGQVALLAAILRQVVVTTSVVAALVVFASMSVITAVVAVAT
jgi:hypothetical protein